MKRVIHFLLLIITLTCFNTFSFSKPIVPINKYVASVISNFTQLDIESDNLINKEKIYSRSDALELRKNLEAQLAKNPNSMAISFALVKFHAGGSPTNGCFKGEALRYATNIFKQNEYLGCLAFEYIYKTAGDLKNAEVWYKNSLRTSLPSGMEWRIVKLVKSPPLGASVVGSFSNGKKWPMYQTMWSSYVRKIMVPKCTGDCIYRVISNFLNEERMVEGKLSQQNW